MTRRFPEATVSQVCSSTKVAPEKTTTEEVEFAMPQPTFLAMGISNEDVAVSPDKKSLILRDVPELPGWVWTLTPSPN
jgi:hypothetical protein